MIKANSILEIIFKLFSRLIQISLVKIILTHRIQFVLSKLEEYG